MTTWARIWTDGSADGRGPGGWAFVAVEAGHAQTEHSGGLPEGATNQQAEIFAAAHALSWAVDKASVDVVEIISDSAYVVNCMNEGWYVQWEENGWRNSAGKPVANRQWWSILLACLEEATRYGLEVRFTKTKGHSTDSMNVRVDRLANEARLNQNGVAA
jgi:ribonuclease HI